MHVSDGLASRGARRRTWITLPIHAAGMHRHPPLARAPPSPATPHAWPHLLQVVGFCNTYTQLLGMGFSPAVAAEALVRTQNDATAATDICLAATS
jgi:hypothetical protein